MANRRPPDAHEVRLARILCPKGEADENSPPDAREGGLARKPTPDARKLAGVGRNPAGKKIRPMLLTHPILGSRCSRHCRASRINDSGRFYRVSGNKCAMAEICPMLASLRATGRNLPGRKSARRLKYEE